MRWRSTSWQTARTSSRNHVAAAADEGVGAGGLGQRDRGTGRAAVGDQRLQLLEVVFGRFAGGEDDVDDVFLDLLVHVDVLDHAAGLDDVFGRKSLYVTFGKSFARARFIRIMSRSSCFVGVGDLGFQHETIDLRLGQRVSTFLLQRVLRRQHQEGLGQLDRFRRRWSPGAPAWLRAAPTAPWPASG